MELKNQENFCYEEVFSFASLYLNTVMFLLLGASFTGVFFFHDDFLTVAEGRNGQNKPNQHHHLYPRKTVTAHGRNLQLHSRLTTDSW